MLPTLVWLISLPRVEDKALSTAQEGARLQLRCRQLTSQELQKTASRHSTKDHANHTIPGAQLDAIVHYSITTSKSSDGSKLERRWGNSLLLLPLVPKRLLSL